jgi:(E)-4-hydroxy-3-methylbut-2-enyl-diphosphate synthase
MERRKTKQILVGSVAVGGGAPVSIQSMLCAPAGDIAGTAAQARALEAAGCEILRLAVGGKADLDCIAALKKAVKIPLVADIQFDYKMALDTLAAGIDKIRLNPGNLGAPERVRAVAREARNKKVPIRVGVNAGSISRKVLEKYGRVCPEAMVEEALGQIRLLEQNDFGEIAVSLKASDVPFMLAACRQMAAVCGYPLHLGVTEAGGGADGLIKSAVGIGALLAEGIGDTIRVSLTADPVEEIRAAKGILKALNLREGLEIVSCPTCSRCTVDLIPIAAEVRRRLADCEKNLKIAVMGCAVNGPGEARDADAGVTAANGEGLLFRKGEIVRRVPAAEIVDELLKEIGGMA